jgi:hypothetical protein
MADAQHISLTIALDFEVWQGVGKFFLGMRGK